MRVFQFHLILTLLNVFWSSLGVPADLHNQDTALLRLLDFSVHDLYRFFHEVETLVDIDLVEWDYEGLVRQTLFQVRHVECRMYVTKFVGQVEFVSHGADPCEDLEGSYISRIKLPTLSEAYQALPG